MTNFNYRPMELNRERTESRIEQINGQIEAISRIPGDVMNYTAVNELKINLQAMKRQLHRDLKYFDAIDRAMGEAVK